MSLAGDSHLRLLFGSLASQLTDGLHTVNFSSIGASNAWAGVPKANLNVNFTVPPMQARGQYLSNAVCILERGGATHGAHGSIARIAVTLSNIESLLLNEAPPAGALPTLVHEANRMKRGLCLTYSAMLFPDETSIGRLYGTLSLPRPDAVIVNTAQWPQWKGWTLTQYRAGLDMLLRNATARPVRIATAPKAEVRPFRRVLLWASSPTNTAKLPKHKANITSSALTRFAQTARAAALMQSATRSGHVAFFDVMTYGTAGWNSGQFKVSSDAIHWSVGSCRTPGQNRFSCQLFKEASRLPVTLYSCVWDATLDFLCGTNSE